MTAAVFLTLITVNICQGSSKQDAETPPGNPHNEPQRQPASAADQDASPVANGSKQSGNAAVKSDGANTSPKPTDDKQIVDEKVAVVEEERNTETGADQHDQKADDDGFDLNSDERLVICILELTLQFAESLFPPQISTKGYVFRIFCFPTW